MRHPVIDERKHEPGCRPTSRRIVRSRRPRSSLILNDNFCWEHLRSPRPDSEFVKRRRERPIDRFRDFARFSRITRMDKSMDPREKFARLKIQGNRLCFVAFRANIATNDKRRAREKGGGFSIKNSRHCICRRGGRKWVCKQSRASLPLFN